MNWCTFQSINKGIDIEVIEDGKRRKIFVSWNHFNIRKINSEEKERCDGTNHLHIHLATYKRKSYRDIRQSLLLKEQKKADGSRKTLLTHEYPLSMMEHLGFRIYSKGLQPLFMIPSRNTTKSDIVKI
ncbi:hypothetical protein GmHk_18G052430 [Glycine max]|nr:hypothetical protein GmHk_18G052430 [Glycine max]